MPMAASSSPIRLPTSTVRDVPYEPDPCVRVHRHLAPPVNVAGMVAGRPPVVWRPAS